MFLLDDQQKFVLVYAILWILLGCLLLAAIILFIIRLVRIHKKGKKAEQSIDAEIKIALFEALGGDENVISSTCEMSRVTIEVKDVEAVNGEALKAIGASGVLFVGNKVKCSFNENAQNIQNLLQELNN